MSNIHGCLISAARELRDDRGDAGTPICRELVGRQEDLGHDRVGHQGQELLLGPDVVIQRHGAGSELGGQAAHRERIDAFGVGDVHGGTSDLFASEARPA